jgi:hypothetical protein
MSERSAGDHHPAQLHRLAEHLEDVAAELGDLVEEEHAVVGEGHLAWPRERATSGEAGGRDRVVRCAERSSGDQSLRTRHPGCHRIDLGRGERFCLVEGRQDARQALREHRLPGPRGPQEEEMVGASSGDLECPLGVFLAGDFGEIGGGDVGL